MRSPNGYHRRTNSNSCNHTDPDDLWCNHNAQSRKANYSCCYIRDCLWIYNKYIGDNLAENNEEPYLQSSPSLIGTFSIFGGLEIDFTGIEKRLAELILSVISSMAFIIALLIGDQFEWNVDCVGHWATSVPLLLAVVRSYDLTLPLGQIMISVALGELVTIFALSGVDIMKNQTVSSGK